VNEEIASNVHDMNEIGKTSCGRMIEGRQMTDEAKYNTEGKKQQQRTGLSYKLAVQVELEQ
jgi:hypothetical protein